MAAYHAVAAHFPIALLLIATLMILIRAFSSSDLALALDRVLPATLLVGLLGGVATFGTGLLIWDWEAVIHSPMARNHTLLGAWALAGWAVAFGARAANGVNVWNGFGRWFMVVVAVVSAGLLAITGTLGGYLIGNTTDLSKLIAAAGWNVYDTFYLPSWAVLVVAGIALAIVAIAFLGRRKAV